MERECKQFNAEKLFDERGNPLQEETLGETLWSEESCSVCETVFETKKSSHEEYTEYEMQKKEKRCSEQQEEIF